MIVGGEQSFGFPFLLGGKSESYCVRQLEMLLVSLDNERP
jgi:hypothetical protein